MGKCLLYTALGLMGIMGTLAIGVVKAETTITHYTGSNISYTLNEGELFTGVGTITITDGTDTITILDRNLGATKAGTGCDYITNGNKFCHYDEVYGYHFQWGNNYGFDPMDNSIQINSKSVNTDGAVWNNSYNNKGYYGMTFIKGESQFGGDYWIDSIDNSPNHYGLRGGGANEDMYDAQNGIRKVNNAEERQGPCPKGWHVPSFGELKKVKLMMTGTNKDKISQIHNGLLIPFGGFRIYSSAKVGGLGYRGDLWTSSPSSEYDIDESMRFRMNTERYELYFDRMPRSASSNIRCFYNLYQLFTQSFTLSFTGSEGGSISTGSIEVDSGSTISRDNGSGTVTISGAIVATGVADEGYAFSGWLTDCGNIVTTGCSFTGDFKLTTYEIKYELDGGTNSQNNVTGYTIKDSVTFENPTKDNHTFEGRYTDVGFTDEITSISTGSTGNITLYAKWKKKSSNRSGGGSSGGGGSNKTGDTQDSSSTPQNNSSVSSGTDVKDLEGDTQDSSDKSSEGQTELEQAYQFAFKNSITTMDTIDKANMDGYIKRGHLAKMITNYVVNVLGKEIPSDIPASCLSFNDEATVRESEEIKDYAIKSCALGLMGIRMKNNEFLPNDYVTRAEFGAVLSRILRGDKYNLVGTADKPRYSDHLNALKNEGIMTKIDNPKMLEKRGYVMIMLMRSVK